MAKIGRRTKEENDQLFRSIEQLMLKGVSTDKIAELVDLKRDTVRKHMTTLRKKWIAEGIGGAETKAELLERANLIAAAAAATHSAVKGKSVQGEATLLKLQLEVIDRIAKLTGAYEPNKTEITGANGGPIQMQVSEHPIDNMSSSELAKRMRNWAEALEEVSDGQQDLPVVAEGTGKDI